jgi:hypothetical protein
LLNAGFRLLPREAAQSERLAVDQHCRKERQTGADPEHAALECRQVDLDGDDRRTGQASLTATPSR